MNLNFFVCHLTFLYFVGVGFPESDGGHYDVTADANFNYKGDQWRKEILTVSKVQVTVILCLMKIFFRSMTACVGIMELFCCCRIHDTFQTSGK